MTLDLSLDAKRRHKWGRYLLVELKTKGQPIPPTIVLSGTSEAADIIDLTNHFRDCVVHVSQKQTFSDLAPRRAFLEAASQALARTGSELSPVRCKTAGDRVFISHSAPTRALDDVQAFLRALGIYPAIAEYEPAAGRSVIDHVQLQWQGCDAALVVLTKAAEVGSTYWPGRGVLVEIGALREHFRHGDGREFVIYMAEEGVDVGAMVEEKVRIEFVQGNMSAAFIQLARELKALELF
jgi:hypothetical protein